jgi:hypothetical protein
MLGGIIKTSLLATLKYTTYKINICKTKEYNMMYS